MTPTGALPRGWRAWQHRVGTRLYGPDPRDPWLSWIGGERLAVAGVPTPDVLPRLHDAGVTHVVNCRSGWQTAFSQDLALERRLFGADRVAAAPMWDDGRLKPPHLWAKAAEFAAAVLDDPESRILIHCQKGRRRSVMVAYAVLRLRGRTPTDAVTLLTAHRTRAHLIPAYQLSVERWLLTRSR
ncbi:MAG: hypothetical protein HOV79_09860 [Hamadaea sp.]|nr:hypothetical protein [Hamadaea sp.]